MWTVKIVIPEDADSDDGGETVELTVDPDETILAAARTAGVWLPADCQQGWCTTCVGRVTEGTVAHPHAKRFFEEDDEAGFALLCTAKPRSDLTVITHQYEEFLTHRAEHNRPPGRSKLSDR
jgi:ferredoxin